MYKQRIAMKKHILLFVLLSALAGLGLYSCSNSHEDDIILYVPKQIREIGADDKTTITYSLAYDLDGRIKSEGSSTLYTAQLHYDIENMVDSVRITFVTGTTDSIDRIFTYNASGVNIRQVTFVKDQAPDTTTGIVTLNAQQLPQSYTMGNTEERYSYDADNKLTTIEQYENSLLTKTHTYGYGSSEYSSIKSPYSEVPFYPAWYFVVYRHMSPVELATKASVKQGSQPAEPVYELSEFILSDLEFITHATKTYHESTGTRVVTYRQDYQKVVFD